MSPELCLVDPDLAERCRSLGLLGREAPARSGASPPGPCAPVSDTARARRGRRPARLLVTPLTLVTSLALAGGIWQRHERPALAPATDAAVEAPTLAWHPVPGAVGYDVVLWRAGRRVLDLWPTAAAVTLPRRWRYRGARFSLRDGPFLWFVYPRLEDRGSFRYGAVSSSGTVEYP